MIITGIGFAAGNLFFTEAPPSLFALVKGIAAGAMLTMIAQTILSETYFKGGSIIEFSTPLGFLAAISLKTLEQDRCIAFARTSSRSGRHYLV
jgi:hypothetical protein